MLQWINHGGSSRRAALLRAIQSPPHLSAVDVNELEAAIAAGSGLWTRNMGQTIEEKYESAGRPSIEELKQAQGAIPTSDPRELLGDFWPEDENIDDFLAAQREWRGHSKTNQAA